MQKFRKIAFWLIVGIAAGIAAYKFGLWDKIVGMFNKIKK